MVSYFFDGYIGPTIRKHEYQHIVEIGVDAGATTVKLLDLAKEMDSHLFCIDPCPSFRPAGDYEKLVFVQKPSLTALKAVRAIDCEAVDSDHNWYTVDNELKLI